MKKNPFFYIMLPTFNRPELILRSVQSVINQPYNEYKLVIFNDGSTSDYKLTKITKHAKRHFWLNDVCTCHGLLPSHSA